jgi:Prp8 binding protein
MIRKEPPPSGTSVAKRSRMDEDDSSSRTTTVAIGSTSVGGKPEAGAVLRQIKRTSGLEAPIVSLAGAHGVSRWFPSIG